ncbi:(2Fe-2S)-binding protein [Kitasatospora camelliae]|uniref:(2Fe-2S)-binding protein n=1 Tax=Kitasatospora camelliae TaxID=3156397 RepID=A0AAU8K3N3_9ACTN
MTTPDPTPARPHDVPNPGALLDRVGRIGPYFAVRAGPAGGTPPEGFRLLRDLYAIAPGGPLAERIAEVGRRLGTNEARVAASTVHLGLAARLWSVALGAAALGGVVPDLHPDRAHWALPAQGPLDLWLPCPGTTADGGAARDGAVVEELHRVVLDGNLAPLAEAVRAHAPVAAGLLDGNAASALMGTVRVLAAAPGVRGREAARRAETLARALLDRPPLHGTGTLSVPGGPPRFRRTSCCLYYRVPGGGLCGDCVFDRPPRRG